jgi:flagellar biosynthetic protein FlhB
MFDGDDRTEFPTPRRLEEARSAGSVPRSPDLCAAIILLVASLSLLGAGPKLWQGALRLWNGTETSSAPDFSRDLSLEQVALQLAGAAAGVLGLACLAAVLANVAQFGFRVTPDVVRPRWSRLNPAAGLNRWRGGGGPSVAFPLKAAAVFAVLAWCVVDGLDVACRLPASGSMLTMGTSIGRVLIKASVRLAVVLLILALGDFAWQRRRYFAGLRMSRQEVLDESRGTARRGTTAAGPPRSFPPCRTVEVDTERPAAVHVRA